MKGQNRKLTRETLNSLARTEVPKYAKLPKRVVARAKGLRARNGNWHFRIKWQGSEVSGDTGLPAKQETVDAALEIKLAKLNELRNPTKKEVTLTRITVANAVTEFVKWYSSEHADKPQTWKWAQSNLAAFRLYYEEKYLDEITPGDMEQFKVFQRDRGLKQSSLAHSLKAVRLLTKYGRKMGWLKHNPLEDVDIPTQGDSDVMHVLSPDEERRYYEKACERSIDLADLMTVMIQRGCRPEEIQTLEQANVDLDRGVFRIVKVAVPGRGVTCKSFASQRKLPMSPDIKAIFERRKDGKSRWMFPSRKKLGTPIQSVQKAHEWVVAQTGIQCRIYDFRHTYATRLAVRGCPPALLAMSMGHSDTTVLRKYVHPSQEDMERALIEYGAAAEQFRALGIEEGGPNHYAEKVDRKVDHGPLTGTKWGNLRLISTKKNEDAA
jgi:site-specific recombinase XerD